MSSGVVCIVQFQNMATFRVYEENKNLNINDRTSTFRPNEKPIVLQDRQVNEQVAKCAIGTDKKKLNVLFDKSQLKPKSADNVLGPKNKFNFERDDGKKKSNSKKSLSRSIKLGTDFSSGNVDILAKNVSRRSRGFSTGIISNTKIEVESDSPRTSCNSFLNEGKIFNTSSRLDHTQNGTTHSPIPENKFTTPYTLLLKKTEKMRSTKLPRRTAKLDPQKTKAYVGDIYMEEYLEDIICNVKAIETTIILPVGFLENFNPCQKIRAGIVNWMLGIQRQIRISDGEFYLAVNLMDQILARIAVPMNMYQLLAISTIWIANKHIGPNTLTGSDMINLSNNAYVIKQLVKLERKVLKIMNFNVHSIEPSVSINFFLKVFEIDHLEIVQYSVYYIMDCSTLLQEFSTVPITVLSAAALNVTVKIFCENLEEMVGRFFDKNMSPYYAEKRKIMESQMYSIILNMTNEKFMFREAFHKYQAVQKYFLVIK